MSSVWNFVKWLSGSVTLCVLVFVVGCGDRGDELGDVDYDVIVYGGSSGGIAASIAAARNGATVLLVCESNHLGGLTSSGLTATDMNSSYHVGGISREFYQKVYATYLNEDLWKYEDRELFFERSSHRTYSGKNDTLEMQWVFESKIAKNIFSNMLQAEGIELVYGSRLNGLEMAGEKIASISLGERGEFSARCFIDASYAGDLMTMSGVSYVVGRESKNAYGEKYAGYGNFRPYLSRKSGDETIDPFMDKGNESSGLLPFMDWVEGTALGAGDSKIQAYCFRLTLTDWEPNRIEIEKPKLYDPFWFEYMLRRLESDGGSMKLEDIFTLTPMPNRKTDTNGLDFVGANTDWWKSDSEGRFEIEEDHKAFALGMIWFLQNDPRVPDNIRSEARKWGLAADEFVDNQNFPPQMYIRESRRLLGDYVMTEHNCFLRTGVDDSIGYGTYAIDSHVVQRLVNQDHEVWEEGPFYEKTGNYQISYRSIVPKKGECENLFVPVCLSASHVAYGSIRMEPVFMVLGHSAGTAAALCAEENIAAQDLVYSSLKKRLEDEGQVLGISR